MFSVVIPASWTARSPASIPRSRNDLSQSSPNCVSPTPMTATSRISALPHLDLPAVLRVRAVVDHLEVLHHGAHGPDLGLVEGVHLLCHRDVEGVAPRPRSVTHGEDAVPGLRDVEDRAQADHDRPGVRVPDLAHEEPRVHLLLV